jgi:uncharacterized protein YcfL
MKKILIIIAISWMLVGCVSRKLISETDITDKATWLDTNADNPIVNVIQKYYSNNDVEIVIKKKFSIDYVNLTQTKNKKTITKTTVIK